MSIPTLQSKPAGHRRVTSIHKKAPPRGRPGMTGEASLSSCQAQSFSPSPLRPWVYLQRTWRVCVCVLNSNSTPVKPFQADSAIAQSSWCCSSCMPRSEANLGIRLVLLRDQSTICDQSGKHGQLQWLMVGLLAILRKSTQLSHCRPFQVVPPPFFRVLERPINEGVAGNALCAELAPF